MTRPVNEIRTMPTPTTEHADLGLTSTSAGASTAAGCCGGHGECACGHGGEGHHHGEHHHGEHSHAHASHEDLAAPAREADPHA